MQDNFSPEERLLRLIKGEHKNASTEGAEKKEARNTSLYKGTSNAHALVKEKLVAPFVRFLDIILLLIIFIFGIYLTADFVLQSGDKNEKRTLALKSKSENNTAFVMPREVTTLKPVSYYSQPVKARNIFTAAASDKKGEAPSPVFMDIVSKFKLQGIISGVNPQAVIEDTNTKQLYFLSPGENIGEVVLKQILPGKVKLSYYGQETELAL